MRCLRPDGRVYLDQAEAGYGLEKPEPKNPTIRRKLLEGSREVIFEHAGWLIRCALLQATDGIFYVVREEYSKIWNGQVMKAGGSPQIRDFERDAILQAEGGAWTLKSLGELGSDISSTAANQLLRFAGATRCGDGATARVQMGATTATLDLPKR